jgi:hypothetical protein
VVHTYDHCYSEVKLRRIVVQGKPRQIVHKTLSQNTQNTQHPEFKLQYHHQKKKKGTEKTVLYVFDRLITFSRKVAGRKETIQ